MPLQDHQQIVSVDDHLVEHPRVWQDRLPQKYLEQGPRIVEADGKHLWQLRRRRCSRRSASTRSPASRPRSGAWSRSATTT